MTAHNLRILYSDDDPDSREIVSLILSKEGFETICPESAQDVLRLAHEQKFDAYLLDSWTPDMSGVELCKRIKEFDAHTPIIFYSAASFQADKDEALAAGAQAYVTKPSSVEELVDAIRLAISSSREIQSESFVARLGKE
jgi:DNA-binding response OmpR family regulator